MSTKGNILRSVVAGAGLAVALAFASGCSKSSDTGGMGPMSGDEHKNMQTK